MKCAIVFSKKMLFSQRVSSASMSRVCRAMRKYPAPNLASAGKIREGNSQDELRDSLTCAMPWSESFLKMDGDSGLLGRYGEELVPLDARGNTPASVVRLHAQDARVAPNVDVAGECDLLR